MNQAQHTSTGSAPRAVFQNQDYVLRYWGREPAQTERVVCTFPDLIHPTGEAAPGWGEGFLAKRGAAVLSFIFREPNWYQAGGFFEALEAARRFLGDGVAVTTYGSSMGGYGALLGAARIGADRCIALCPQFSIDPAVTPFERRFGQQAKAIGPFRYDLTSELRHEVEYIVVFDPTHRVDRAHIDCFPKLDKWRTVPFPGSSHGVLPTLIEVNAQDELFRVLMGSSSSTELRGALRRGRHRSFRYVRRMGNLCSRSPDRHASLRTMMDLAQRRGDVKLLRKWNKPDPDAEARAGAGPSLDTSSTPNPSHSDIDADLLRQANRQGRTGRGLLRFLLSENSGVDAETAVSDMRKTKRARLSGMMTDFDWSALEYEPNAPRCYSQTEFETRRAALHSRCRDLLQASKALGDRA